MKTLKFLVNTFDKNTYEDYKKGTIKEFKDKRADEILSARTREGGPFAEIVEEIETARKNIKSEKAVKKVSKKNK